MDAHPKSPLSPTNPRCNQTVAAKYDKSYMYLINAIRSVLGLGPIPGTVEDTPDLSWDAWPAE